MSWTTPGRQTCFCLKCSLAALLPAALMSFRRIRSSAAGIGIASGLTLLGMVGYRFNLCVVAFARPEGVSYFPTLDGVCRHARDCGGGTCWYSSFSSRHLKCAKPGMKEDAAVPDSRSRPSFDPLSLRILMPESLAAARRYSLALVTGAALAAAALPRECGVVPYCCAPPVHAPMVLNGSLVNDPPASRAPSYRISLQQHGVVRMAMFAASQFFIIDGNRNGRLVAFPHQFHRDKLGGENSACYAITRHMPFDQNTSCSECHRDMYLTTDIFSHSAHIARLDGNSGCSKCHTDASAQAKTRETAKACSACHQDMVHAGSIIRPPKEGTAGEAVGYLEAMHGLCITCHKQKLAEDPQHYRRGFADCATCHRDIDGRQLHRMGPYAARENDLTAKAERRGGAPK